MSSIKHNIKTKMYHPEYKINILNYIYSKIKILYCGIQNKNIFHITKWGMGKKKKRSGEGKKWREENKDK